MKTLKVKSMLLGLLAVCTIAILISACEQATTENLEDIQHVEATTGDIEERGSFSLNSNGDSHIYWPFWNSRYVNSEEGTDGWELSCGTDCGWHHKSDYYADDWKNGGCGTYFKAPFSGKVIFAGEVTWGYGKQIIIQSTQNGNFAFRIAHLQGIYVWNGQYVKAGQIIGTVGTTGNSTGCHGHCVLYKNIYKTDDRYPSQTGLWRLQRGYGLDSGTSGGPNKFAAQYYFDAGNKSANFSTDKGGITKEPDLDGKPSCGPVVDIKGNSEELRLLEEQ